MWVTLLIILRNIINDTESTTYTDARLKTALASAAQLMLLECSFDYDYVIDVSTPDISPDPVSNSDDAFVALVTLKAAVLITGGEYRMASKNNIVVNDAWSSISLAGQASAYKALYDSFVKQYNESLMQQKFGNMSHFHAILSPYTINTDYRFKPFY